MDRDASLGALRWSWGEQYEISEARGEWRAVSLSDRRTLRASDPMSLREMMVRDCGCEPIRLVAGSAHASKRIRRRPVIL
jgi:hypothetical protein